MATARELLEQADALMRSNRLREAAPADAATDIPVLTEVVADGDVGAPGLPAAEALPEAGVGGTGPVPSAPSDDVAPASAAGNIPVLTETVEDFEPISIIGEPDDTATAARWPDVDDGEITIGEPRRSADDVHVASTLPQVAPGLAPAAPPGGGDPDAARWTALAEEVRMQVLQRIDIFTDTGLQEQLTVRLQPIVDRASADLVATINQQVGQLLRGYVAEAIEREIEKWRHDGAA